MTRPPFLRTRRSTDRPYAWPLSGDNAETFGLWVCSSFTSRVGIFEVLTSTSSVRALIRDGRTLQLASAMFIGRGIGMQTIDGSLEVRLRAGDISFEVAMQYAQSKENFAKLANAPRASAQPASKPGPATAGGPPRPIAPDAAPPRRQS